LFPAKFLRDVHETLLVWVPLWQAQRGKAGKLKKAKAKYADQDEEDRALAMAALASSGKIPAPTSSG
jgi:hypothetical protein